MLTLYITDKQLTLVTPLYFKNKIKQGVLYLPFESFDSDLCAESLLSYVKENCLMGSPVVLAISMDHVLFREVVWDMEFSDWQVYQSVRRDFEHYFPDALSDEFWMDFEVIHLKNEDSGSQLKLQIYAVPKKLVQPFITILEYARLKLRAVDMDALALAKIFPGLGLNNVKDVPKLPDQFKAGIIVEEDFAWFIECNNQSIVRLKKSIFLTEQPDAFLNAFQAFLSENLWDISKIFFISGLENPSSLLELLKDRLNVTPYPVDFFKQFNFLSGLTGARFIKNHPFSSLVHLGLREHYGN